MIPRPPLILPLLALAGFLGLAALVIFSWAPLAGADAAASDAFREYGNAHPRFVTAMWFATHIGAPLVFLLVGFFVSLGLAVHRQRRRAFFCALVTGLVPLLWGLMHWLLPRPRPSDGFVAVASNGFPSGHTTNAMAAMLVVVFLLWPSVTGAARIGVLLAAGGIAFFVGVTRAALLAHWPADVLGGWLLALVVVPLAARGIGRDDSSRRG